MSAERTLIAFAGDDLPPRRIIPPSCHSLFLLGHDTASIAEIRGLSEAAVLRRLTVERSHVRGLPNPYEGRPFE